MGTRVKHHSPAYSDAAGRFGLSYHLELIADGERVGRILAALKSVLKPHMVLADLGCGTAIFSIAAARLCRRVYAVETDPAVLHIARNNVARSGMASRVKLVNADARSVKLPERVDVLLCEMMSVWLVEEPQIPVINRARARLLSADGVCIPRRVVNLIELGNRDYTYGGVECRASLPQFTGLPAPRIMTTSHVFLEVDFSQTVAEKVDRSIEMEVLVAGVVNCARLTSIVDLAEGVSFYSTDSLMPVSTVPLVEPVEVRRNERVTLRARYRHRSSLDAARFEVLR